jgi:hypothetical protein
MDSIRDGARSIIEHNHVLPTSAQLCYGLPYEADGRAIILISRPAGTRLPGDALEAVNPLGDRMEPNTRLSLAERTMMEFAVKTGLSPVGRAPRRYLWTDAFAVCNFLGLYGHTGKEEYRNLAVLLIDQVHNILGRHREDDARSGWVSGLDEEAGKIHPTKGGLRIGKQINERRPDERPDARLEWERDGQYYHYLTKWMHALNRASQVTGNMKYNEWAIELAKTAHAGFTYTPAGGGRKMMYWKMSIDLSYSLVPSMGHHDPLDGLVVYSQLRATSSAGAQPSRHLDLTAEINDLARICTAKSWVTDDPLGIGGLLCDACKVGQMIAAKTFEQTDLLESLLEDSRLSLNSYIRTSPLNLPAGYRLAFRELGLSIGLRAVEKLRQLIEAKPIRLHRAEQLRGRIEAVTRYVPVAETIEEFWLEQVNRESATWQEHHDINTVMLATSLAPEGYLSDDSQSVVSNQ